MGGHEYDLKPLESVSEKAENTKAAIETHLQTHIHVSFLLIPQMLSSLPL